MWLRGREVGALERFLERVPELASAWTEHLRENGEPLPHVFFGDVSRFVRDGAREWDSAFHKRFWAAVEEMAEARGAVENIVAVSLIENLVLGDPRDLRALTASRTYMRPRTAALIEDFERYRDEPH